MQQSLPTVGSVGADTCASSTLSCLRYSFSLPRSSTMIPIGTTGDWSICSQRHGHLLAARAPERLGAWPLARIGAPICVMLFLAGFVSLASNIGPGWIHNEEAREALGYLICAGTTALAVFDARQANLERDRARPPMRLSDERRSGNPRRRQRSCDRGGAEARRAPERPSASRHLRAAAGPERATSPAEAAYRKISLRRFVDQHLLQSSAARRRYRRRCATSAAWRRWASPARSLLFSRPAIAPCSTTG